MAQGAGAALVRSLTVTSSDAPSLLQALQEARGALSHTQQRGARPHHLRDRGLPPGTAADTNESPPLQARVLHGDRPGSAELGREVLGRCVLGRHRLEPGGRLLVAGHKVLQRRATRVGRSTTAAWTPTDRTAESCGGGWGGGRPSCPNRQQTHTLRHVILLSGGLGSTSKKIQDGGRESPTPRTWESASLRLMVGSTETALLGSII